MKWISVNERLPKPRVNVLCWLEYEEKVIINCRIGWLKYASGDKDSPYFVVPHERVGKLIKWTVTHWMHIVSPLPPIQSETKKR